MLVVEMVDLIVVVEETNNSILEKTIEETPDVSTFAVFFTSTVKEIVTVSLEASIPVDDSSIAS